MGLVVFPGCLPAGLFVAADLLRGANARRGATLYEVSWVGATKAPVAVGGGQNLVPEALLNGAHDVYLLPGLWAVPGEPSTADPASLVEALRRLPSTCEVFSYCAGVRLVAASGRLDSRRATATWWMQPELEARFPRVRWCFAEAVVHDGTIATAAGPSGYLPLAEVLLARALDERELSDLQDLMMMPQARNLHPLFRPLDEWNVDEALRPLMAWAFRVGAADLSLARAATQLGLSERTLGRRLRELTGQSAAAWLRQVKLKQAADLLIRTAKSAKQVAFACGFSSEAAFSRAFHRMVGLTPLAFRRGYADRRPPPTRRSARSPR